MLSQRHCPKYAFPLSALHSLQGFLGCFRPPCLLLSGERLWLSLKFRRCCWPSLLPFGEDTNLSCVYWSPSPRSPIKDRPACDCRLSSRNCRKECTSLPRADCLHVDNHSIPNKAKVNKGPSIEP